MKTAIPHEDVTPGWYWALDTDDNLQAVYVERRQERFGQDERLSVYQVGVAMPDHAPGWVFLARLEAPEVPLVH